jgi:hypothetical protein
MEAMSMSEVMLKLRQVEKDILATGKVDGPELERLRRELYAHDKIERPEADFLVELHKRVQHLSPAFDLRLHSLDVEVAFDFDLFGALEKRFKCKGPLFAIFKDFALDLACMAHRNKSAT